MKTFIKTIFILNILFLFSCKAQTTTNYITFYNDLVPKLNSMVPNKTQYYNQNFSNFYNELQNKNIDIVFLLYDPKVIPGTKYYVLKLFFTENMMWRLAVDNDYQLPAISITFQNEIPPQIDQLSEQSHGRWDYNISQFFANMKIESIRFIGLNGYDSTDNSLK
jgi:hypothetical protein